MDELIKYFNGLMSGSLPIKEVDTAHFIVTLSADPTKLKMEDKRTHEVFTLCDFSEREVTLLAYIAVMEGL